LQALAGIGARIGATLDITKTARGRTMITPSECRQRAADCRQMVERAPNARVQAILIDVARTWTRLALEAEHNQPRKIELFIAGAPPEGKP
jgi:hypothetical protein